MSYSEQVRYDRVTLEKFKVSVNRQISETIAKSIALHGVSMEAEVDREAKQMLLKLRAFVLGEKLQEIHVKYPADWWQALKERWFPRWALKRWPVVYTEKHYHVNAYYPKLQLPNEFHQMGIVAVRK